MDSTKNFNVIEWCAGYGGISLGLKRVIPALRTIAYSEIEAFACANLVAKMEEGHMDAAPIWTDLKTFPSRSFRGKVDCLIAGFPCQPFSAAGKRGGDEDPRHLFPYIKQGLIDMQPELVCLENVEGIISAKLKGDGWDDPEGTSVLLHVLRELERSGYTATWGIFSAEECGAPHRRKRVFILAHRRSLAARGLSIREDEKNAKFSQCGQYSWPARPGQEQHEWEPPRVLADQHSNGCDEGGKCLSASGDDGAIGEDGGEAEPQMGRNANGGTDWLDNAELEATLAYCDNRTDELRLLGNGVVPATAEKAFRTLIERFM